MKFCVASLLLLALSSWACVASAQVDPSPYLLVRTVEQVHVVDLGVIDPKWIPVTDGGNGPYNSTQVEYPSYVISLDTAKAPPTSHQDYTLTYTSTDITVLTTSASSESGTALPNTQFYSSAMTLCVGTGTAEIIVNMELTNPPHKTLVWSYKKTCTVPLIEVGTTPWDRDVVFDSQAVGEFSQWVVLDNTYNLYMNLGNTPSTPYLQQPFYLTITSANTSFVEIANPIYNTSYTTGTEGYVWTDASQPIGMLTIPFTCHGHSVSKTVITVTLNFHYSNPVNFTFIKQCNAATALTILNIGTTVNGSDISNGGVIAQGWSSPTGQPYLPNSIPGYVFSFHMCFGCSSAPFVGTTQQYLISYDNAQTPVYDVIIQGPGSGVLPQYSDILSRADIICNNPGTATTNWQVDLGDQFELVQFAMNYQCVYPLLDLDYGNINNVVATKSVVTAGWNTDISAAETVSSFFLYLDQANDPKVLKQAFYEISFMVDNTIMNPTTNDPNFQQAPYISADYNPVEVTWNCLQNAVSQPVTMSIRYGWQTTMQVHFTKDCIVAIPPNDNPGSGWSAAGIFFFTLFLLCLLLCVAGCGWNYFREEKRGLEIVPLYASCTACYDKVRGTDRKWTPQMDTTGRTNYGNLEDAGSSYQSNL